MNLLPLDNLNLPPLEDGKTLVLTPNKRIARKLLTSYAQAQIDNGKSAWNTPHILPVATWIMERVLDCQDMVCYAVANRQILNAEQESVIWQRCISEDLSKTEEYEGFIGNEKSVASTVQQAWQLMASWEVSLDHHELELNAEGRKFKRWAQKFAEVCDEKKFITTSQLPSVVIQAIKDGMIEIPENVVLFAFDDISPIYRSLFNALESAGATISTAEPVVENQETKRLTLHDAEEEMITSARWAKHVLSQSKDAVIGIVVPELTRRRNQILRIYSDVFEPQHILPEEDRYTPPFNISAGVPFNSIPVIKEAFRCLSLDRGKLSAHDMLALVCSPFIGGSVTEFSARAVLSSKLRRLRATTISLETLLERSELCPLLSQHINKFTCLTYEGGNKLPSQWAYTFNEQLQAIGWPGERILDSEEYQAVAHWDGLLDKMAHMDAVIGSASIGTALDLLRNLAQLSTFQPETEDSPIQILGSLEAAGLQFTHLWVMGLSDDIWPAIAKPNTYLPTVMQRNPGLTTDGKEKPEMPHASAERELEYARTLTRRYMESAHNIVFSSPLLDGDRELRASPLITHIQKSTKLDIPLESVQGYARVLHGQIPTEIYDDSMAPPVTDNASVKGGISMLEDQAACPFRAFANHRLNIRPFEPPRIGLEHRERGTIIHRIEQTLWDELKSQEELLNLTPDQLSTLLAKHTCNALDEFAREYPILLGKRFRAIEHNRIVRLIAEKMKYEEERENFTVAATEKHLTLDIGGVSIKVVIDRIDETNEGLALIDYKTGQTKTSGWDGERPDSPQLPTYAAFYSDNEEHDEENKPVTAVMYSHLRAGDASFAGLANHSGVAAGVTNISKASKSSLPKEWNETLNYWRGVITDLATQFASGKAIVDPKKPQESCRFCDFKQLCRY